jgi:hypothetical protein
MKDVIGLIVAWLALGAFIGLPASVALMRAQTSSSGDGVTIPQQRGPLGGDGE